tara:strand:- start:4729 stop:5739 length:1011 start_codon:yes stop_codon:yes gene_type:complete
MKNVEIFGIGKWRGSREVAVDGAMLDRIVDNFQNLNSKVQGYAPAVKLGHNNRIGEPAFGWVTALRRDGDKLVADFSDVPENIVDKVSKRQYNSVSIELWPSVEYAGQVFKDVLGAVALLGAEWPAVKGLKPLSASIFAEDNTGEWFEKDTEVMTNFTQEQHDALVTAEVSQATTDLQAQVTSLNEQMEAETECRVRAETALKMFTEKAFKQNVESIVQSAIDSGKILPKNKENTIAMAESFAADATKKFKVGDKEMDALEMFTQFISDMPTKVDFKEHGNSEENSPGDEERASDILDAKAKGLMKTKDFSGDYSNAIQSILESDKELASRYAQEV